MCLFSFLRFYATVGSDSLAWNELDADAPEAALPTHRLAILHLDWERLKAADIFHLVASALASAASPPRPLAQALSAIVRVSVFPSEFGLQRMQYERQFGPALYPKPELAAAATRLPKHTPPTHKKEPRPSAGLLDGAENDADDGDEDEAADGSKEQRDSEVKTKNRILTLGASTFWFLRLYLLFRDWNYFVSLF